MRLPAIAPLRFGRHFFALLAMLFALAWPHHATHAEGVDIRDLSVEHAEDGYRLSMTFSFELTRALEDALKRGIPLYFTTEVQVTQPRWYWFDAKTAASAQTIRISYNVLTQQYRLSFGSGLQQNFAALEDALAVVRRQRMLIAEKGVLKSGEVYTVMVRMGLDVNHLPKPFQVHALNSSDWRFSSDWKQFTLKVD